MGKPLTEHAEILFRQIHPSFYQDGVPSKSRFMPQSNDNGLMSVDRGALTTPAASHAAYLATGKQSAAVFGVSVEEFAGEALPCVEDAVEAKDGKLANPYHALVDYTSFDEKARRLISMRLWAKATARGRLHP